MRHASPKAVLERDEVRRALIEAAQRGPLAHALFTWVYEFGARASEPGLQRVDDVDLVGARARVVHLKTHAALMGSLVSKDWHFLLAGCRRALPIWLDGPRWEVIKRHEQAPYLFPSAVPGRCHVCHGTGKRSAGRRGCLPRVACHHCAGTGKRWGIARHEVGATITSILTTIGVREGYRHPHVLRHSLTTHLLDAGIEPKAIQERVGHERLATTLDYLRATEAARAKLAGALADIVGVAR